MHSIHKPLDCNARQVHFVTMKFRSVQPKSGAKHVLFGTKYKKLHKLHDENWTSDHKIDQYNAVITIYEKNQVLKKEEKIVQDKIRNEYFREQTRRASQQRLQLRELKLGERQAIKKLFKNHRAMQLRYAPKPSAFIVMDLDQRIYEKRKKLDLLLFERKRMCDLYERQLNDVSQLQDRIRCKDSEQLPDDARSNQLLAEIKDAEMRIKTMEMMNKNCRHFINRALNDSLYFNLILNGIEEDAREQDDFLERVYELGVPAVANQRKFDKYYRQLNYDSNKNFNSRLTMLMKYRDDLKESANRIRDLIRDKYIVHSNRYNRETASMLDLKVQFEHVEKPVQTLIATTASAGVDQVFDRFEEELVRCDQIKQRVDNAEEIVASISQKIAGEEAIKMAQEENFTKDDINANEEIEKTTQLVEDEQQKQRKCDKEIKKIGKIALDVRRTFIHFDGLLKNVGQALDGNGERSYPSSYLNLPLLKFEPATKPQHIEFHRIEDNVDVLMSRVMERVNLLMTICVENADETFIGLSDNFYHDATLTKLRPDEFQVQNDDFGFSYDNDTGVPNRKAIKALSKMIQAQNKKQDY